MSNQTGFAIDWLIRSKEPAVRYLTRRDLVGEEAATDRESILEGPWMRALLAGQGPGGGFGVHPYKKWTGAHWRLVSMVELAIPSGHPGAVRALETVLSWLLALGWLSSPSP